jgi:CHAD domain-containing protein
VLLADISGFIKEQPALKIFKKTLLAEEKKQLRAAHKYVKSIKTGGSARRMEKIIAMLKEIPAEKLNFQLLHIVDFKYAAALEQYRFMNTSPLDSHFLRLAFKKFRYMLEIVHPLLENFPEQILESMHDYQSQLGDIQDMNVALQRMDDIKDSHPALDAARAFYQKRRAEALSLFMEGRHNLLNFWRTAPDQTFPWENRS